MIVNLYIKGVLVKTENKTITWFDNTIPNMLKQLGYEKDMALVLYYSLRKRIQENDIGVFIDNPNVRTRLEFIGE